MSEEIIKIDEDTVKIVTEKTIDLVGIRREIEDLESQETEIKFIEQSEYYPITVQMAIDEQNSRAELVLAEITELKRIKQEELNKYVAE